MVSPKDMKLPIMGGQVIRERLPAQIEKLVRRQREITEAFLDGRGKDTRMTPLRFMAYTSRLQTMAAASEHYWTRAAEAGASTKPLLPRSFLRCAIGLTSIYMVADLTNEGIRAYQKNMRALAPPTEAYHDATLPAQMQAQHNTNLSALPASPVLEVEGQSAFMPWGAKTVPVKEDWRAVVAERAVFQTLSSLVLPAATLTAVVRHSTKCLSDSGSVIVRRWGPLAIGLFIVPMLPYAFDEPVDKFVRSAFDPLYAYIEKSRDTSTAEKMNAHQ
ncbi:hypothetical protein KEM56_002945 [Ascosphaera pollenicola]|nr:hypothetical protein KEM56_002945 [Ascosphaera pollenicola]